MLWRQGRGRGYHRRYVASATLSSCHSTRGRSASHLVSPTPQPTSSRPSSSIRQETTWPLATRVAASSCSSAMRWYAARLPRNRVCRVGHADRLCRLPWQKKTCEYKFYTEFQSHEPEFDYLKSLEIEEKINKIKWCKRQNAAHFLLSTNGVCSSDRAFGPPSDPWCFRQNDQAMESI